MNDAYKRQVKLLLNVLPEIAKEDCFAMHGGTAINLFLQDMPRLSVDIDLTYVEIAERSETLDAINAALLQIKERIEKLRASIRVQHKPNVCKLQISQQGVQIKVEVNMVGRGLYIDESNGHPKRLLISGPGQTFQGLINRIARGVTTKTVIQSFNQKSLISINQRYWISLHVNNAVGLYDLPLSPPIVDRSS